MRPSTEIDTLRQQLPYHKLRKVKKEKIVPIDWPTEWERFDAAELYNALFPAAATDIEDGRTVWLGGDLAPDAELLDSAGNAADPDEIEEDTRWVPLPDKRELDALDDLARREGEALHPARESLELLHAIREQIGEQIGLPTLELEIPPVCDALIPALRTRLQALMEVARARRT